VRGGFPQSQHSSLYIYEKTPEWSCFLTTTARYVLNHCCLCGKSVFASHFVRCEQAHVNLLMVVNHCGYPQMLSLFSNKQELMHYHMIYFSSTPHSHAKEPKHHPLKKIPN